MANTHRTAQQGERAADHPDEAPRPSEVHRIVARTLREQHDALPEASDAREPLEAAIAEVEIAAIALEHAERTTRPTAVQLAPLDLTMARWAVAERVLRDLRECARFLEDVIEQAGGDVALTDAWAHSRNLLASVGALDRLGWPVGDPDDTLRGRVEPEQAPRAVE
jgi:hypothetical protein